MHEGSILGKTLNEFDRTGVAETEPYSFRVSRGDEPPRQRDPAIEFINIRLREGEELSLNLGDGRGQAAAA
jgi:hypothetical protein